MIYNVKNVDLWADFQFLPYSALSRIRGVLQSDQMCIEM